MAIARPLRVMDGPPHYYSSARSFFSAASVRNSRDAGRENIVMEVKRVPSNVAAQSQRMRSDRAADQPVSEVAFVFSRTGTPISPRPDAPQRSDTYIIVKHRKTNGRTRHDEDDLIKRIEAEATSLPVTRSAFRNRSEMPSFNELIAGVARRPRREGVRRRFRGDAEDRGPDCRVLRKVDGAESVKVEETAGLPFLEIRIDKAEIGRRGLSLASVQDLIETAVGGRPAGLVFEGIRRFQIVVRLNDALRNDISALGEPACAASAREPERAGSLDPLRTIASFEQTEGATRSVARTATPVVATAESRSRYRSLVAEPRPR